MQLGVLLFNCNAYEESLVIYISLLLLVCNLIHGLCCIC